MTDRDSLGAILDDLVPAPRDVPREWGDVLRRAGGPPTERPGGRHRRRLTVAALAALISACAVVLADPFPEEENGVLDRALAAVGDGPVMHVVTRSGIGGTLIDLESGRRTRIRVESELWFDPARGYRAITRLGGRVVDEYGVPLGKRIRFRFANRAMQVFTRDYRAALRSGRARVLREGSVAGTPVYWIRVELDRPTPPAAPCGARLCHDVAVSRQTYEPVFVRFGPPGSRFGQRILELESLPAGSGEIPGRVVAPTLPGFRPLPRRTVDRSLARRLLGTPLVWPGARVGGLTLARIEAGGEREFRSKRPTRPLRFKAPNHVITLLFGERRQIRSGRPPASWHRLLVVNEALRPTYGLLTAPAAIRWRAPGVPVDYVPPAGSALLTQGGRQAILRKRDLLIAVIGSSPELVQAAIEALRR
jgi:hypothetical protein